MRYAITKDGKRIEAQKNIEGFCPLCNEKLIAKCGSIKINHWSHKNNNCDKWYENKTQWHIDWQNEFPKEWQEIPIFERENNEKHIADICTPYKTVIEFQHSYLPHEIIAEREAFYTKNCKSLIWVVDGTRLKNDFVHFQNIKIMSKKSQTFKNFVTIGTYSLEEIFPKNWIGCNVPVIFDFGQDNGKYTIDGKNFSLKKYLWYLFPKKTLGEYVVMCISKRNFIRKIKQNEPITNLIRTKIMEDIINQV